jgi:hypothetical protein
LFGSEFYRSGGEFNRTVSRQEANNPRPLHLAVPNSRDHRHWPNIRQATLDAGGAV